MKKFLIITLAIILTQIYFLYYAGQPLTSLTGKVMLWTGTVNGPENSQQFFDWYTFSHIIHGFLFFWLLLFIKNKFLPKLSIFTLAICALCIEVAWEVLENSPIIINRYREATLAFGYSGDSILNSVSDSVSMLFGFFLAYKINWKIILATLMFFELLTLYFIKDNLTLNVLMLIHPIDTVRTWQAGL